jgi:hypothetical protein
VAGTEQQTTLKNANTQVQGQVRPGSINSDDKNSIRENTDNGSSALLPSELPAF